MRERNYELYGENLLRAMNGKKRDVSSGKEKAQGNGERDGKEREQGIICRQKGWEMNEWNKNRKENEVLAEKFITSSLFVCLPTQLY